jgi:hypothetical protein
MGGNISAADAEQCSFRSHEVRLLAGRISACCDEADYLLGRFHSVQLLGWESPAGRAYRNSLALQASALGRAREQLRVASAAILLHAQEVAAPPWPQPLHPQFISLFSGSADG